MSIAWSLLPELHEPVLTDIGSGLLILRGFERCDRAGVAVGECPR